MFWTLLKFTELKMIICLTVNHFKWFKELA